MTIHCLMTKICELEACFLYFSYVLAQNGGWLVARSTPPGSALDIVYIVSDQTCDFVHRLI